MKKSNLLVLLGGLSLGLLSSMSSMSQEASSAELEKERILEEAAAKDNSGVTLEKQKQKEVIKAMKTDIRAAAADVLSSISACSLCWTCGGNWPIHSGTIATLPSGSRPTERGSNCSGGLAPNTDVAPYLCCN